MAGGNGAFDIVSKLWKLCDNLQGGGVSYKDYVNELTYLLFLKMLEETGQESRVPEEFRWRRLYERTGEDQLIHYRRALLELGNPENKAIKSSVVRDIYADAKTALTKPVDLQGIVNAIEKIDWFTAKEDGLGNLYEGLLEKTTGEKKSKAGQYFTTRALINCMVELVKPQAGEIIQDPAAGTGGFLVAADRYIKDRTDDLYKLGKDAAFFQRHNAYVGAEFVRDTYRLCLMNLILHGIESRIECTDTLEPGGEALGKADLILSNPPFNKFPGATNRSDFSITAALRKGPIPFVEHFVRSLKPGGRAAVVLSDNVLFEGNGGQRLRSWWMELCDLHTILRLPTGIFYAQGVKTNVVFFTRGKTDKANTKAVWVYDLRANMPSFGKTRPLTKEVFDPFIAAYGDDPFGKAKRKDEGEEGRFRCFTRKWIAERGDNLDISWLRDENSDADDGLSEPDEIAAAIVGHLQSALAHLEVVSEDVGATESASLEAA